MSHTGDGTELQSMMADMQHQMRIFERVLAAADPARYKSMVDSMMARGLLTPARSGDDDGVGRRPASEEGPTTETDASGLSTPPQRPVDAGA